MRKHGYLQAPCNEVRPPSTIALKQCVGGSAVFILFKTIPIPVQHFGQVLVKVFVEVNNVKGRQ